jgi:hypothetical protein
MNIIAHRGFWLQPDEKNSAIAFTRALKNGFGIETDLRDFSGHLVISHDIPSNQAMNVEEFLDLFLSNPVILPIALNIKSDGLCDLVSEFISRAQFRRVFAFDMSVPDMRSYLKNNIPVFTRLSEYEPIPVFLDVCRGVWIDSFKSDWYSAEIINSLLNAGKEVAIVSPELHGRSHIFIWELIRNNNIHRNESISICTDFPMEAQEYFYGKN